jgi:uracil-DNA glycosylase
MTSFSSLLTEVRACTICEAQLPLGPRPVLQLHPNAKILIAGQAPGRKVHNSGVPFDDASGNRLREWLDVTREVFYDPEQIAILPMGFCFPAQVYHFGKSSSSLTELVKSWRTYWPNTVPLPHPSPRNNLWLRRNSWFEAELLPPLRQRVSEVLTQ